MFDTMEFRKALGSFTTGVTIVTTQGTDQNDVGLTVNSFNSVSLHPPMILWSLGKAALSMPQFQSADFFAVHILAEDQKDLSSRFSTRGIDKFSGLSLSRGPANIPLLDHCAARFTCKTAFQYEGGDHIIFVGEVVDFSYSQRQPLLFHDGRYGQLAKIQFSDSPIDVSHYQLATLGFLLRFCSHNLLVDLKMKLAQYDISVAQYFFLVVISKAKDQERSDDIVRYAELGDNPPTYNDIDNLIKKGLVRAVDGRFMLTSAGSILHTKLSAYYKLSESSALNVLEFEERQALQISLSKLASYFPTS